MTNNTRKLRAIVLAALMIGSVIAIANPASAGVDANDPEPVDLISAAGNTQSPVINGTNNNLANLPRIQPGDSVVVRINVSNGNDGDSQPDPVNVTLTDDPATPTSGDFGASGQRGVQVTDGGINDLTGGSANGVVEVKLTATAFAGSFSGGETLSVYVRDSGNLNDTGASLHGVTPAVKVVTQGPTIGAPGTDGAPTDNIQPAGQPELRDAYGAEYDDSIFNGPTGADSADPQPGNMDNLPIAGGDEQDAATDAATRLEQVQVVADVEDPEGTTIQHVWADVSGISRNTPIDVDGNGTIESSETGVVIMHPDLNGNGIIDPSEEGVTAPTGAPNGNQTYIGTFYVATNAPLGSQNVTVYAENARGLQNSKNSQNISLGMRNSLLPDVTGQQGDNRVTVVFDNGVYTQSNLQGDLTRQDFDYVDQNGLNGATSIKEVHHNAGSRVAVLVLDDQLGAQDLVTSVTGRTPNAKSDEIRIVSGEIFDFQGAAIPGGPSTDQSIIEAAATETTAQPKPKDGFNTPREINPEEQVDVSVQFNAYGGGDGDQAENVAVSLRATDSTGATATKDATETILVDGATALRRNPNDGFVRTYGDQDGLVNNVVETEFNLKAFSAEGAADGRLNITAQASGRFDANGPAPVGDLDTNNNAPFTAGSYYQGTISSSLSVDAVRPTVVTARAQPSAPNSAAAANEIDLVFSEFVLDNDGELLTKEDFNYIDNNGGGATEIVSVRHIQSGDPATVILEMNSPVTSSDVANDRITVVPNQVVDADHFNRVAFQNINDVGDLYKIGNTARDGLDASETVASDDINIEAAASAALPGVTVSPSPISGEDSVMVRTGSSLSLVEGGFVTFLVEDSQGNTFYKTVKDGGVGDYDSRDKLVLTRLYLTDFVADKAQAGELTVYAKATASQSWAPSTAGAKTTQEFTPTVDSSHPQIQSVTPSNNNEVKVTFTEGVYARGLNSEDIGVNDLRYVDKNGIDATKIVDVKHTAGSDTAILTLNNELSANDIQEGDAIGTVIDQIEDEAGNTLVPGSLQVDIGDRMVDKLNVSVDDSTGAINVKTIVDNEAKAGVDVTFTVTSGPGTFDGASSVTKTTSYNNNVPQVTAMLSGYGAGTTVKIEAGGAMTTVTVGSGQNPVIGDSQSPATNVDSDVYLEDVNGDGTFNVFDVQVLLDNLDSTAVTQNAGMFDFDDDGDVDIFDVQELLSQT